MFAIVGSILDALTIPTSTYYPGEYTLWTHWPTAYPQYKPYGWQLIWHENKAEELDNSLAICFERHVICLRALLSAERWVIVPPSDHKEAMWTSHWAGLIKHTTRSQPIYQGNFTLSNPLNHAVNNAVSEGFHFRMSYWLLSPVISHGNKRIIHSRLKRR